MASTTETGHAKNVANFEDLISFCTGYGAPYNPSKASIKLAALGTKRTGEVNGTCSRKHKPSTMDKCSQRKRDCI